MRFPFLRESSWAAAATISLSFLALPSAAYAEQSFPTRPVSMVSPFAAGGTSDLVARTIAIPMSEALGQQVIVVNKTGAGGTIGIGSVATAAADGYSIVLGGLGSVVFPNGIYKGKLRYDAQRDLVPIGVVGATPVVVAVRADLPYQDLKGLVEGARANPAKIRYGSAGVGGTMHLTAAMLEREAGIQMTHIPYRGSGPALTDLLAGQIDAIFIEPNVIKPHLATGKLRVIAVASTKRSEAVPSVPTTVEQGFPKVQMETWYGLFAPKNTSADVLNKLRSAMEKARNDPRTVKTFQEQQIVPSTATSAQFTDQLKRDFDFWLPMISDVCAKSGCE